MAILAPALALAASEIANGTYPGSDGRIAFVKNHQIYTTSADGGDVQQLTRTGRRVRPEWSPDGLRIAYLHRRLDGDRDVWVMNADGSEKSRVTRLGNVRAAPTWSAGGRWLAFAAGRSSYLSKVRSTKPFGQVRRMLADGRQVFVDRFLSWSPDGSTIAIFNHDSGQFNDTIEMYDLATKHVVLYAEIGAECCGWADWPDLSWSPAGAFGFVWLPLDGSGVPAGPSFVVLDGFIEKDGDKSFAVAPSDTQVAVTNDSYGSSRILISDRDGSNRHFLVGGTQPDWQSITP